MSKSKTIDIHKLPLESISEKAEKIPKKLTVREERELDKMFDQSEMDQYFMKAQGTTPFETIQLAGFLYSDEGIRKITNNLRKGDLQLSARQHNVDGYLTKEKISEEEKKAMQLRLKREQIERQLSFLDQQTSLHPKKASSNPEIIEHYRPPNIFTKEQHEEFVNKVITEREIMTKKHEENVKKLQKGIEDEEQNLRRVKEMKESKVKEKRRKEIEKSLKKKKQQHERFIAFELQTRKEFKEKKSQVFLHEKIEEKYQKQILAPLLEEKKKKLKEIREISKAFNIEELKNHEREYLEKRNQSFSVVKSRVNEDWHYKAPEKTERLSRFLQDEKLEQRKKLEEKKRAIDEKIARQDHFLSYLKEKYTPKIDEAKKRQIEERIQRDKSKRRESTTDSKILGMSYLEEAKRLKKKTIDRPETQKTSEKSEEKIERGTKKAATDYLLGNRKQKQFYEGKRRKRLERLIQSKGESYEKLKKLQRQEQKISQEFQMKQELIKMNGKNERNEEEALELLLSGIKAKMGIISVFKGKEETI